MLWYQLQSILYPHDFREYHGRICCEGSGTSGRTPHACCVYRQVKLKVYTLPRNHLPSAREVRCAGYHPAAGTLRHMRKSPHNSINPIRRWVAYRVGGAITTKWVLSLQLQIQHLIFNVITASCFWVGRFSLGMKSSYAEYTRVVPTYALRDRESGVDEK
jgi:hypothetical protein